MNRAEKFNKALQYFFLIAAIAAIGIFVIVWVGAALAGAGIASTITSVFLLYMLLSAAAILITRRFAPPVYIQLCILIILTLLFQMVFSLNVYMDFDGDFMFYYSTAIGLRYEGAEALGIYNAAFPGTITYPAILAAIMKLAGLEREAHVILNHVIVALLSVSVYFILKRKMDGPWALAGGLLISMHPFFIIYSTVPNAELMFGMLIIASFSAFLKALDFSGTRRGLLWTLASAVLCGFTIFSRPLGIIYIIALFIYIFVFSRLGLREKLVSAALYMAMFILFSSLNSHIVNVVTGYDAPSSSYGWNLYVGASEDGQWNTSDGEEFAAAIETFETPSELQKYFAQKAFERYREFNVGSFILHSLKKLNPWIAGTHIANTASRQFDYSPFFSADSWGTYYAIASLYDLVIMFFALAACIRMLAAAVKGTAQAEITLVLYFIGSVMALMILEIASRYTVSYRMIFCIFAAYEAQRACLYLSERRKPRKNPDKRLTKQQAGRR